MQLSCSTQCVFIQTNKNGQMKNWNLKCKAKPNTPLTYFHISSAKDITAILSQLRSPLEIELTAKIHEDQCIYKSVFYILMQIYYIRKKKKEKQSCFYHFKYKPNCLKYFICMKILYTKNNFYGIEFSMNQTE